METLPPGQAEPGAAVQRESYRPRPYKHPANRRSSSARSGF